MIRAKDFSRKYTGGRGKTRKEAEKHGKSLPEGCREGDTKQRVLACKTKLSALGQA